MYLSSLIIIHTEELVVPTMSCDISELRLQWNIFHSNVCVSVLKQAVNTLFKQIKMSQVIGFSSVSTTF